MACLCDGSIVEFVVMAMAMDCGSALIVAASETVEGCLLTMAKIVVYWVLFSLGLNCHLLGLNYGSYRDGKQLEIFNVIRPSTKSLHSRLV